MKIIDLSLPLYTGMPVYPGDPETSIEIIQTIENDDWNMRRIEISSHDGTHLNVPIHGVENGKNLDDYKLNDFMGESVLYESYKDIQPGIGVIFNSHDIDEAITQKIIEIRPKFVGLSSKYEFNIVLERKLLEAGIISFERIHNTDQLPKNFFFHGAPLNIKSGDGSPIRAYAIVNQ